MDIVWIIVGATILILIGLAYFDRTPREMQEDAQKEAAAESPQELLAATRSEPLTARQRGEREIETTRGTFGDQNDSDDEYES